MSNQSLSSRDDALVPSADDAAGDAGDRPRRKNTEPVASPPSSIMRGLKEWVRENFGLRGREHLRAAMEEALDEHEEDSTVNPEEKRMFMNLLDFGDLEVSDVMVHRADIVAVPETIALAELRQLILESAHSRVLVYRQTLDSVVGMVHAKDLVRFIGDASGFVLADMIRPVLVVPPSMKTVMLLARMRSSGMHLAVVVDEYGGTDGIVTLEDLFECIVGDIQDEHDTPDKDERVVWVSPTEALIDARIEVDLLAEHLKTTIRDAEDEEEYDTLAGFLFHAFGHVPAVGESMTHRGMVFQVVQADARRIHEVRVVMPQSADEA